MLGKEIKSMLNSVHEEAWNGLIPTEFSMDVSEVTSLQRPLPLYLLLPRMGFLPCVAEAVAHHFGEVAPEVQRTLWFEEAFSGEPLRWHLPTGVLFDLLVGWPDGLEGVAGAKSDVGEESKARTRSVLPWRITVHFQGCPRRQVFALEKEADITRHYMNALKQALYLQLGSSRVGMSLAKDKQTRLWQAVKSNDTKLFHEMETFLGEDGGLRLVPVRILKGSTSPSQLPIPTERPNGQPFTLRDCLSWFCPELPWRESERDERQRSTLPLPPPPPSPNNATEGRALLRGTSENDNIGVVGENEVAGLSGENEESRGSNAPPVVMVDGSKQSTGSGLASGIVGGGVTQVDGGGSAALTSLPRVVVQGVEPPLDAPVARLWGALRHPDHFLYVVLRKS